MSLGADEITYILSCLPRKVATRFKTVCRAWKDIISTPYFRSLQVQRPACDVLGFFRIGAWSGGLWLYPADNSEPPVEQRIGGGGRDGQIAAVLAVCDGLVLVRTGRQDCYVWNPSNRSSVRLPWHWGGRAHGRHHGLAKGSSPNSFEIVSIDSNENRQGGPWHSCSIYSSATCTSGELRWGCRWSEERANVGALLNPVGGACVGRTVHYLADDGRRILAVDARGQRCKHMDLPEGPAGARKDVRLAPVDDDLYLVFATPGGGVQLWVLEDLDGEEVQWKMVLEFAWPLVVTSVFFDGHRIGVVDVEDWYSKGEGKELWINFYDTRNRRWEGTPHLLPPNLIFDWPTLFPFIKDTTIVGK